MVKGYLSLDKLEAYKLSRQLSVFAWEVYETFDWRIKKIIGDQFVTSVDSIGANIAEGYGRFHYLDKVRFYYNARGSLLESRHWLGLLLERKFISNIHVKKYRDVYKDLRIILNGLINSAMKAKMEVS